MRFKIVLSSLLFTINAFGVCDHERSERDKFRDLTAGFGTATSVIGTIGISTGNIPLGLLSLIPAGIGQNQLRIFLEKENNLKRCEEAHAASQLAELKRQQQELETVKNRNTRIAEINAQYDSFEATARDNHRNSSRAVMQRYLQEGRNIRDPNVQAELRAEIRSMEAELNVKLQRLADDRYSEIQAV